MERKKLLEDWPLLDAALQTTNGVNPAKPAHRAFSSQRRKRAARELPYETAASQRPQVPRRLACSVQFVGTASIGLKTDVHRAGEQPRRDLLGSPKPSSRVFPSSSGSGLWRRAGTRLRSSCRGAFECLRGFTLIHAHFQCSGGLLVRRCPSSVHTMAHIDEVKDLLDGIVDTVANEPNEDGARECPFPAAVKFPKPKSKSNKSSRKRMMPRDVERASKRLKGLKKKVQFSGVKVYYFERSQGFSVVPSVGGSSLGMDDSHHFDRDFTIAEHRRYSQQESEQKSIERHLALRTEVKRRRRLRSALSSFSSPGCSTTFSNGATQNDATHLEFEDDSDEDEDIKYVEYSMCDDDDDVDDEEVVMPEEECYFQAMGTGARKLLLKSVGVPVDESDREENDEIRASRAVCGCSCPDGKCVPETCQCAIDNIKCQFDRPGFPCACTTESCENPEGRVEFNEDRVRTHFLQTMMRLRAAKSKGNMAVSSPMHIRFSDESQTSTSYLSTPPPLIYQNALENEQNEMSTPERPPKKFPVTPTYVRSRLDVNKNTALLNRNINNVHNAEPDIPEEPIDAFPPTESLLGPVKKDSRQ
uniref:CSRNP_N domain-containing protein n=1 Tax=Steinernema glaseri TaxID=37863 RepID=A0A1I7ZLI5_9BILA